MALKDKQKQKKKTHLDSKEVSEGEWSSEEEELKREVAKIEEKEKLLGKRKKRDKEDKGFFADDNFEVVP